MTEWTDGTTIGLVQFYVAETWNYHKTAFPPIVFGTYEGCIAALPQMLAEVLEGVSTKFSMLADVPIRAECYLPVIDTQLQYEPSL